MFKYHSLAGTPLTNAILDVLQAVVTEETQPDSFVAWTAWTAGFLPRATWAAWTADFLRFFGVVPTGLSSLNWDIQGSSAVDQRNNPRGGNLLVASNAGATPAPTSYPFLEALSFDEQEGHAPNHCFGCVDGGWLDRFRFPSETTKTCFAALVGRYIEQVWLGAELTRSGNQQEDLFVAPDARNDATIQNRLVPVVWLQSVRAIGTALGVDDSILAKVLTITKLAKDDSARSVLGWWSLGNISRSYDVFEVGDANREKEVVSVWNNWPAPGQWFEEHDRTGRRGAPAKPKPWQKNQWRLELVQNVFGAKEVPDALLTHSQKALEKRSHGTRDAPMECETTRWWTMIEGLPLWDGVTTTVDAVDGGGRTTLREIIGKTQALREADKNHSVQRSFKSTGHDSVPAEDRDQRTKWLHARMSSSETSETTENGSLILLHPRWIDSDEELVAHGGLLRTVEVLHIVSADDPGEEEEKHFLVVRPAEDWQLLTGQGRATMEPPLCNVDEAVLDAKAGRAVLDGPSGDLSEIPVLSEIPACFVVGMNRVAGLLARPAELQLMRALRDLQNRLPGATSPGGLPASSQQGTAGPAVAGPAAPAAPTTAAEKLRSMPLALTAHLERAFPGDALWPTAPGVLRTSPLLEQPRVLRPVLAHVALYCAAWQSLLYARFRDAHLAHDRLQIGLSTNWDDDASTQTLAAALEEFGRSSLRSTPPPAKWLHRNPDAENSPLRIDQWDAHWHVLRDTREFFRRFMHFNKKKVKGAALSAVLGALGYTGSCAKKEELQKKLERGLVYAEMREFVSAKSIETADIAWAFEEYWVYVRRPSHKILEGLRFFLLSELRRFMEREVIEHTGEGTNRTGPAPNTGRRAG